MADQLLDGSMTGEGSVPDAALQATLGPESVAGEGNIGGGLTVTQAQSWMSGAVTGAAEVMEANLTVLTRVAPTSRRQLVKHGGRVLWETP